MRSLKMKRRHISIATGILFFLFIFSQGKVFAKDKFEAIMFYSPGCKSCRTIKQEFMPDFLLNYKDKVEIQYCDIADKKCLEMYLTVKKHFNTSGSIPSILIGEHFLLGKQAIKDRLEGIIQEYVKNPKVYKKLYLFEKDIREIFNKFTPLTVSVAGLIDGINPCAFTVLIFFISFLTLMGYRKRDFIITGISFITAVYLTYLLIGYGIFRGLYGLGAYHTVFKIIHLSIAVLCFLMAYLNLKDFLVYRKTGDTEGLKVKLPSVIRNQINAVIGKFYRKDKKGKSIAQGSLILTAFVVGFLVSILEAICTGQVYLPVIVMISKVPDLRSKAISYLLLYNLMFVVPLLLILFLAAIGTGSKKIQDFFRAKIGLVKILMFILFLGLGLILIIGGTR